MIITGFETGTAPDEVKVRDCRKTVSLPILLGSGITLDNADSLLGVAVGAIVGSWFKKDNNWRNPVDFERAKVFMNEVKKVRLKTDGV